MKSWIVSKTFLEIVVRFDRAMNRWIKDVKWNKKRISKFEYWISMRSRLIERLLRLIIFFLHYIDVDIRSKKMKRWKKIRIQRSIEWRQYEWNVTFDMTRVLILFENCLILDYKSMIANNINTWFLSHFVSLNIVLWFIFISIFVDWELNFTNDFN